MPNYITFNSKVVEKKQLTHDVIEISFSVPPEFSFKAGQFVMIKCVKEGESKNRSYSIKSPPSQKDRIDIAIKIVEHGFASEIFTTIKIGDEFELKGPFGQFLFDGNSNNNEFWFIGTGTGVGPLYSMIFDYIGTYPQKKFTLVFGVKTQKELFYHEDFLTLQKKYNNFDYIPTLSREQWEGKTGHVQDHLGEDLQNKTFYICGVKEMVLETRDLLLQKGVLKENIKFERYT